MRRAFMIPAFLLILSVSSLGSGARKFYPDDPIWVEPRIPAKKPPEVKRSEIVDFLESSSKRGPGEQIPRAADANTVGGVPDSAWFTNRIGKKAMSPPVLARGSNLSEGPDTSHVLEVTAPKLEGATAGFRMKDKRGDTYFVKLDPRKYPQLATSAEAISTKFFYAFGYNVPENYLVFVKRDQLRIAPKTKAKGKTVTEEDLDRLLEHAPLRKDGTYQVLASKKIEGDIVGTFKFQGTRPDDPNDVFPHEDRRELRALRLFCAWLNHVDIDTINTMDVFEGKESSGYVRHYLIDFGTTMGSGGFEPQRPRVGHEYPVDIKNISKSLFTFGLWERTWQKIEYPDFPQVGNFEASHFRPEKWKSDYSVPAFERMTLGDAFWAARIISHFSDEAVRAIVRTGKYDDPRAEEYIVRTLFERRDRIVSYYFSKMNPLDDFEVRSGRPGRASVGFRNLGVDNNLGTVERYEYAWHTFDNASGLVTRLGSQGWNTEPSIPLPEGRPAPYLMLAIRSLSAAQPDWNREVRVYLASSDGGWRVVGVEREEEAAPGAATRLLAGDGTSSSEKKAE